MSDTTIAYYRMRVRQEDLRATETGDVKVAAVHRRLAAAYRMRLRELGSPDDAQPGIRPSGASA